MEEIIKSGNKIYFFETVQQIPSIEDIILFPDKCKTFIDSVTQNPKHANADLYAQFTSETYSIFIYAFACKFEQLRPTSVLHQQFEMNARRVERLCKKRKITLSETESKIIDTCKDLHLLQMLFKDQLNLATEFKSKLAEIYL